MKLSGSQMVWMIVTTEIVPIIGLIITPVIGISNQDAWLSMLVGGGIGVVITALVVHLSILHPNQTLAQFSQALLGKWLGRIIVLPYLIVWFMLSIVFLRSFVDFIQLVLVDQETPTLAIMILFMGIMIYLTCSTGITGIGRYCEIVGPVIILALIVSFVLNIGNLHLHHLLPVYSDSGWATILKGSLTPAFWLAGPTLLVTVSFMQPPQKALSSSILGIGIIVIMVVIATLMVLLVFGPNLATKLRFSYIMYVKTIDVFEFIQNMDVLILLVWIFGISAHLSLYFFIANYEMAHWFHVKKWRRFIWFSAPVVLVMAMLIPNDTVINSFWNILFSVIFPVLSIGIPLLLWIISLVKKQFAPL